MIWIYSDLVYTQDQFLAGLVPSPFRDLGGHWIKPRVRLKARSIHWINPLDHEPTK